MNFLLACASAALVNFCFPPHLYGNFLAWFALLPFFLGLFNLTGIFTAPASPASAANGLAGKFRYPLVFLYGFTFGFFYCAGVLSWWIHMFVLRSSSLFEAAFFTAAICCYGGAFTGLFSLLCFWLKKRTAQCDGLASLLLFPVWVAASWVSLEFILTKTIWGLTWTLLGYSFWNCLPVLQFSSITGVWGLSFLAVMPSAALAAVLREKAGALRKMAALAPSLALILGLYAYGSNVLSSHSSVEEQSSPPSLKVAGLHANIGIEKILEPDYDVYSLGVYKSLLEKVAGDPSLVLWPELSVLRFNQPQTVSEIQDVARRAGCYQIVGAQLYDEVDRYFNSAVLFSPGGEKLAEYRKNYPVPFSETSFFGSQDKEMDTFPGKELNLLPISGKDGKTILMAPTICWELAIPGFVREFVKKKAQVLINMADGSWFDKKAKIQYFMMGRFRAVENRRFLVLSANNGISGVIDPWGVIRKKLDSGSQSVFVETVFPRSDETFYTRFGNFFAWFCVVLTVSGVFFFRRNSFV